MAKKPRNASTGNDITYRLALYLPGQSMNSLTAERNLREILERHASLPVELEIVDIQQTPDAMEEKDLLAVPTLIRESPAPELRIVGDFSDEAKVLSGLGLKSTG